MPYTQNPYLPKVRAKAVNLVKSHGWSMRQVARYLGVNPATVSKWVKKAPPSGVSEIPTKSSRPKSSPLAISQETVSRIVELRLARRRCAQIIHAQLQRESIQVSLSTVKRVLQRKGLIRSKSKWKKYHFSGERPIPEKPGILVETDTIHQYLKVKEITYIYTLIDVYSRWAYAQATDRINTLKSLQFISLAQKQASFSFNCIQSDNGSEFSKYFSLRIEEQGIRHRHTRVRKPNDNAHIERFNRTIQDELKTEINKYKTNVPKLNMFIQEYLNYYNNQRLHMGINYQTPNEMLPRC